MKNLPVFLCTCLLAGCTTTPTLHRADVDMARLNAIPIDRNFSSLQAVNNYVNGFRYVSESDDHWKSLPEFLRDGGGDCEDFALAKAALIVESGLAQPQDIFIVVVHDNVVDNQHAVLDVRGNVLDNQRANVAVWSSTWFQRYNKLLRVPYSGR